MGKAEPADEVPGVGRVEGPGRNTAEPRVAAPATAAQHAERARRGPRGVGQGTAAVVTFPVLAPFPYVSGHVVQAQLICGLAFYGMSLVPTIVSIPGNVANSIATGIFVTLAFLSATRGILPFGFGRQAEVFPRFLVELADELLAVVPTHLLYWEVIAFEVAGVASHHRLPQGLGHLGFPNVVVVQAYFVDRFLFIISVTSLFRGGAHLEGASLHQFHGERNPVYGEGLFVLANGLHGDVVVAGALCHGESGRIV